MGFNELVEILFLEPDSLLELDERNLVQHHQLSHVGRCIAEILRSFVYGQ